MANPSTGGGVPPRRRVGRLKVALALLGVSAASLATASQASAAPADEPEATTASVEVAVNPVCVRGGGWWINIGDRCPRNGGGGGGVVLLGVRW